MVSNRTRQARFSVRFGFLCEGMDGESAPREFRHDDLSFALAMVDPFNHGKWMEQVASLRRRGDRMTITMTSGSDEHGMVARAILVERV